MKFDQIIIEELTPVLKYYLLKKDELDKNFIVFFNRDKNIEIKIGIDYYRANEFIVYINRSDNQFSINDLISYTEITLPTYISNERTLYEALRGLELIFEFENKGLLNGDKLFYNNLVNNRNERIEKLNTEKEIERITIQADLFWKNKDYQKYIEIVDPIKEKLSKLYNKRLFFAKNIE